MAEWLAPFQLPKFTTDEFEKKRAEYTAKHGYHIHVPGWADIIKIRRERPLTEWEVIKWKNRQWSAFSEERFAEIVRMKEKRREKFRRMLASPTPDLLMNAASVMTALDNAQDALTTLAVIGRVASRILPRILGKLLTGPVGWLMLASDIINLFAYTSLLRLLCLVRKRSGHGMLAGNPFSTRARLKRARRLRRGLPSFAESTEILQTTADVFGVGICLGPIMGLLTDVLSGAWRTMKGQSVTVHWSIPDLPYHAQTATAILRHMPLIAHFNEDISDEDHLAATLAHNFALQVIEPYLEDWHPLDMIDGIQYMELVAPAPTNPLTREVIQEAGYDPDELVGWPGSTRGWTTFDQLKDATEKKATFNFKKWCEKRPKDMYAFLLATNAWETTMRSYAMSETLDNLFWDHTPAACFFYKLFAECWTFREVWRHGSVDTKESFGKTMRDVTIPVRVKVLHPDVAHQLWLMFSPNTVIYKKPETPDPVSPLDPQSKTAIARDYYHAYPQTQIYTAHWLMEMYFQRYTYYEGLAPRLNICDMPPNLGIWPFPSSYHPLMQR